MVLEIGPHKVKLGNVLDGIEELMNSDEAAIIYSDPPWGSGNLTYWETMRLKMDGLPASKRRQTIPIDQFLEQIITIAELYVHGYLVIEYGEKWADLVINKATKHGFRHETTIGTLYQSGAKLLPMHLHIFSNAPNSVDIGALEKLVTGTHGYETVKSTMRHLAKPGKILLDPCCGMGYSAQAAIDYGMIFRGNEMIKKRLQKTITRLERAPCISQP